MLRMFVTSCVCIAFFSTAIAQQQQGMSQCQNTFIQNLNNCVQKSQMDFQKFLHLVTNGTNGQAADNAGHFREDACSKQQSLVQCGVEFMRVMINSTACLPGHASQDQRPLIDGQFRTILASLDEICAHPCRRTLTKELRNCYTDADLDPNLFLSNSTMGRGAIIGTTTSEAEDFCKHKDALISCMKQKRDQCPESSITLRTIGLDIDSMEKGVEVLCAHKNVYVSGIDCFAQPTEAVIACQRNMAQKTVELMMSSQQQNLPQHQFFNHFCDIRLEHVSCDLESWAKKNHKACSEGVMGLRTELECGLLPDNCGNTHKEMIDQVCHHENFKREMRPASHDNSANKPTTVFSTMAVVLAALCVY